jgi:hypothetical protein
MQSDITNYDVTAISIQLNELKSRFDMAMRDRDGGDFKDLRETYLQMKELECYMKALQWGPEHQQTQNHTTVSDWR